MKRLKHILIAASLFTLCGCGTTDVWKEWENEGVMNEETRLRPSEVKEILCAADGWKMSYEGVDFYLQFDRNGNVVTNTNEKILRPEVKTEYHLDFQGERTVLLTLSGNSSLQYLNENRESTFLITEYADNHITAKGQAHGLPMNLTIVSTADLQANIDLKQDALRRIAGLENISSGALRVKGGDLLAYYMLSADNDNHWTIHVTTITDGKPVRTSYAVDLDISNDTHGVAALPGLEIEGYAPQSITYDYDDASRVSLGDSNLVLDFGAAAEWVEKYNSSWSTHVVDRDLIGLDLSMMPAAQIEFDDRGPRNIVICPGSVEAGQWWYVFCEQAATANNATCCVVLRNTNIYTPWGGYGDDINLTKENFTPLLSLCYAESGVWVWEKEGYTYIISPTNSNAWFRMR